jgi:hypothetical protein
MSSAPTIPPLTGTITVDVPVEWAFRVFTADGPEQTTVELEHRRPERFVDGQALRDGITGGGGWSSLLELFAKAATNQA